LFINITSLRLICFCDIVSQHEKQKTNEYWQENFPEGATGVALPENEVFFHERFQVVWL
jgi:hypothetical protein